MSTSIELGGHGHHSNSGGSCQQRFHPFRPHLSNFPTPEEGSGSVEDTQISGSTFDGGTVPCVHFVMWTARACPLFTGPVITKGEVGAGDRSHRGQMLPLWKDSCGGGGPCCASGGSLLGTLFLVGTFCKPACAMDWACSHYTRRLMGAAS